MTPRGLGSVWSWAGHGQGRPTSRTGGGAGARCEGERVEKKKPGDVRRRGGGGRGVGDARCVEHGIGVFARSRTFSDASAGPVVMEGAAVVGEGNGEGVHVSSEPEKQQGQTFFFLFFLLFLLWDERARPGIGHGSAKRDRGGKGTGRLLIGRDKRASATKTILSNVYVRTSRRLR